MALKAVERRSYSLQALGERASITSFDLAMVAQTADETFMEYLVRSIVGVNGQDRTPAREEFDGWTKDTRICVMNAFEQLQTGRRPKARKVPGKQPPQHGPWAK